MLNSIDFFDLFKTRSCDIENPLNEIDISCNYFDSNKLIAQFNKDENFKLLSWNICSLNSKFQDLKDFVELLWEKNVQFDILAIQETWKIIDPNLLKLKNYNLVYKTRKVGQGGGVAIYIHEKLKFKELKNLSFFHDNIFESICIEVELDNNKKILVSNVYRPNTPVNNMTHSDQIDLFIEIFTNLQNELDSLKYDSYILSDINIDILKFESNEKTNEFLLQSFANGFLPLVGKPTRVTDNSRSCIDQIFTNRIFNRMNSGIILNNISDHFPIFSVCQQNHDKKKRDSFIFRTTMNENTWNNYLTYLNNINWTPILESNSTENCFSLFMTELYRAHNLFFKPKKVKVNKNVHTIEPFMTKGLMISRAKKINLGELSIKDPSQSNVDYYKKYRLGYNKIIRTAKAMYYEKELEQHKTNPRKSWEIIRTAMNKGRKSTQKINEIKVDGMTYSSESKISNKLNEYFTSVANDITNRINPSRKDPILNVQEANSTFKFTSINERTIKEIVSKMDPKTSKDMYGLSNKWVKQIVNSIALPLTHTFNLSLLNGEVPTQMKVAKVIPIFKQGDDTLPNNYRPISLLPIMSKLLEKIVANQLTNYLQINNILFDHQYGFQAKKSTVHPMIHLINEIGNAKNKDFLTIGVFCDITKGFDTVSHSILLKKMKKYGIKDKELQWFTDYLDERKQFVQINDSKSQVQIISKGVPQGSILGPLLFLIFINDLPRATKLLTLLFADDTSFLISGKSLREVLIILNKELKLICEWFRSNELSLHPDKTNFMVFNKNESSIVWDEVSVQLNFNNEDENKPELITKLNCINSKSETPAIKFLGVYLDPELNFKYHIKTIQAKISKSLYTIKSLKNLLNQNALISLYYAFIHSHLSYCLPIWSSCRQSYLDPLVKIQKKAMRIITGRHYNAHTANIFNNLGILPLHELSKFTKLTIMYDFINKKMPSSFSEFWRKNNEINPRTLRNSDEFHIPLVRKKSIEFFPAYYFQKLWNENCCNDLLKPNQPRARFLKNLKLFLLLQLECICRNPLCLECS